MSQDAGYGLAKLGVADSNPVVRSSSGGLRKGVPLGRTLPRSQVRPSRCSMPTLARDRRALGSPGLRCRAGGAAWPERSDAIVGRGTELGTDRSLPR